MQTPSFYYYNPEAAAEKSHQEVFTPVPSTVLKSSPMPSQEFMMHTLHQPTIARSLHKSVLLNQEPHVLSLDTEFGLDELNYPRTPDLSSTSSAMSSPPHSSYLPTPTNGFFESLTGVKEGCEHEVKSELLASFDFSRAGSPPLTPVFVNPPNVTASQVSELLSTSSCPSLSPSPSPAPQQSFASQPENFCDPRALLVNTKSALINQLDIPTLPAFIPSNDDLLLSCGAGKTEISTLEPLPPVVDSVPFFDSFSDLDSETDFITDLSQDTSLYAGHKRQRLESIPFSEDLSESSFDDEWSMSPLSEISEMSPSKKQKIEDSMVEFDFTSNFASSAADSTTATPVSGAAASDSKDAGISSAAGDSANSPAGHANRRGRKQSLTDDPSKTFVCTLCSRRFRRQEHLKRHYRSLHTQDKPFECTDCGKKFSRSDNLAQHARTHGNTTTLVGLGMPEMDEQTAAMSDRLFHSAAAVSSASSSSSEDEKASAKKRKRDE